MTEISIRAEKFMQLFQYGEHIGLDVEKIAHSVGLSYARIEQLETDQLLPAQYYSKLYRATVQQMQLFAEPIPWAAGLGSDAFELMCRCMISGKTLGQALSIAARFNLLLYPQLKYKMHYDCLEESVSLHFENHIDLSQSDFIPEGYHRVVFQKTIARASGLLVWHGLIGWLIGEPLKLERLQVAAPYLNQDYEASLIRSFGSDVIFEQVENRMIFSRAYLDQAIIQSPESLHDFFDGLVQQLILSQQRSASSSSAIKSLLKKDIGNKVPSFENIAEKMGLSPSSLRRRMKAEATTFQQLKDEVFCDLAIEKLLESDEKVADISAMLGFSEPSSFVRAFKKWTGKSPKSYRENFRLLSE
jgi:AraC-like DNA-binding protein